LSELFSQRRQKVLLHSTTGLWAWRSLEQCAIAWQLLQRKRCNNPLLLAPNRQNVYNAKVLTGLWAVGLFGLTIILICDSTYDRAQYGGCATHEDVIKQ
jgi:hypothetical protein